MMNDDDVQVSPVAAKAASWQPLPNRAQRRASEKQMRKLMTQIRQKKKKGSARMTDRDYSNMEVTFMKDGQPVGGVTQEGEYLAVEQTEDEKEDKSND